VRCRILIPLLGAAVATVLLSSAGATAGQSRRCGSGEGTTLVAGRRARIFSLPSPSPTFPHARVVFGCLVSTGHTVRLGNWYGPLTLKVPWAAGLVTFHHGRDSRSHEVIARNLSSGERRSCRAGAGHSPRTAGDVISVALKRNGSLAWAGHAQFGVEPLDQPTTPEIVACDSQGERLLESGASIELRSLAVRGSTLTWTNAGVVHSALLR
jgi:hypothetical protein